MSVLTPMVEGHFFEDTLALAYPAIVVTKNFDASFRQVPSPEDPRYVGTMSLGCEWPNQEYARGWFFDPVENRVQVSAGYFEIPGLLGEDAGRIRLDLRGHGCWPSGRNGTIFTVYDTVEECFQKFNPFEHVRVRTEWA